MAPKTTRGKLTPISGDGPKAPNAPPEPSDRDDWRTTFRADIPSSARIYDYFLGGKDNYPADRGPGDQIIAHLPNIREATQINRAFVPRAVRYRVNRLWPASGNCAWQADNYGPFGRSGGPISPRHG